MKGRLSLVVFLDEIGTAIPLRPYIALVLLNRGLPLALATWVAGFPSTEDFKMMVLQLAQLDQGTQQTQEVESQEEGERPVKPGSLRERFIEYVKSQ